MSQIIKKFENGKVLEYDRGKFDLWCVYLKNTDGKKFAPKDSKYFCLLQKMGQKYGIKQVYNDFTEIYNSTTKVLEPSVLQKITQISLHYGKNHLLSDIIFTIIYTGMIAEENKESTKLGKRIKRLGIHQLFFDNMNNEEAANYSRRKGWPELDRECKKRGF